MANSNTINPNKISFMDMADTDILFEAATGVVDLNEIAREILVRRGIDQQTGRRLGREAARGEGGSGTDVFNGHKPI